MNDKERYCQYLAEQYFICWLKDNKYNVQTFINEVWERECKKLYKNDFVIFQSDFSKHFWKYFFPEYLCNLKEIRRIKLLKISVKIKI